MTRRLSIETLDNRRMLTSLVGADAVETRVDEVSSLEADDSGEAIQLEIELTSNDSGSRATYLKYELTNVQVTAFDVNASGNDESPPTVTIANNFEEYKATYNDYATEGDFYLDTFESFRTLSP